MQAVEDLRNSIPVAFSASSRSIILDEIQELSSHSLGELAGKWMVVYADAMKPCGYSAWWSELRHPAPPS